MKVKNALLLAILCIGFTSLVNSQTVVNQLEVSPDEAKISLDEKVADAYLLEIGGPGNYYWKKEVENVSDVHLSNQKADGTRFEDGIYTLQVTPIYQLSEENRTALINLRNKNDQAGIAAYRQAHNLPEIVNQFNINFSIRDGKFVNNKQKEARKKVAKMGYESTQNHPALYASLNTVEVDLPALERPMTMENTMPLVGDNKANEAQVFTQDVITQGSMCVGIDCSTSESFGFDTGRYKENNLRIHFDDTSASASFPSNDWRISINDSGNGGANYFAVEDATAGTRPMTISAGAGNNAIYVKNNGDVGLGTANPILELHVADGDTPTMRLEQNGANGWTPQTWDVAGNETNFFVRDVNNSSNLIFRLRAGAPANSLFVQNNGRIGLGTETPSEALHLKSGNMRIESGGLAMNSGSINMDLGSINVTEGDIAIETGSITIEDGAFSMEDGNFVLESGNLGLGTAATAKLDVAGSVKIVGNSDITGNITAKMSTSASFQTSGGAAILHIDAATSRVGIGKNNPGHQLELSTDDAVKPSGGTWSGPSDRRLKTNIKDYTDGLAKVLEIRPVSYEYNGKLGLPTDETFIGVIAQEMQEVAPYTVKDLKHPTEKGFLAYDGSSVTYMLVNAVQEQQEIIETQQNEIDVLKAELAELQSLKSEVAQLVELVKSQSETTTSTTTNVTTEDK